MPVSTSSDSPEFAIAHAAFSSTQSSLFPRNPLFPTSAPATGSFNGLHPHSKFLAIILLGRFIAVLSLSVWLALPALAQNTDILVVTGNALPGGDGTFSTFGPPVLNDSGETAFITDLAGASGNGGLPVRAMVRVGSGGIVEIARQGETAPGGPQTFSDFTPPTLNATGQVAFHASLSGGVTGIYTGDGGPLTKVVRIGDAAPGDGALYNYFESPAFNDAGQTSFTAELNASNYQGIFHSSGATVTAIARIGDSVPDNGTIDFLGFPVLNNAGQTASSALLANTSGGNADNAAIYRGSGGALTEMVRTGDPIPGEDPENVMHRFRALGGPSINELGNISFHADYTAGTALHSGIFHSDGVAVSTISRRGDTAPGAPGVFSFFDDPVVNSADQVAFEAGLTGTANGFNDNEGVYFSSGGVLREVIREAMPAPDGNGVFSTFHSLSLNDNGQIAFTSSLRGTIGGFADDIGLYFFNSLLGLLQVVREGDPLLGSTVTQLGFRGNITNYTSGDEGTGLNDAAQIAFSFTLADGRSGIAVWTAPETPRITAVSLINGNILLSGTGVPGRDVAIYSSPDLGPGSFIFLTHATPDANGIWQYEAQVPPEALRGFFRLGPL